ncbi:MAG: GAF domain-containing protein, partial [Chloroflexota bacterium]
DAQTLLAINWAVFGFWLVWIASTLLYADRTSSDLRLAYAAGATVAITMPVVFITLKSGYMAPARFLLVVSAILVSGVTVFFLPQTSERFILILMLPLAIAGLVLDRRGLSITSIALLIILLADGLLRIQRNQIETVNPFIDTFRIVLIVLAITSVLFILNGSVQRRGRANFEESEQIRLVVQSLTDVTPQTEITELHQRLLRLLRNTSGYDLAQIYLLNDDDVFARRIRSGIRSIEELSNKEAFSLGDASARSEAARVRQIVQVTAYEPAARSQHLLPSIQQGIIVPMVTQGKSIGIIDLQRVNAIQPTPDELQLLQIIADEVAAITVLLEYIARQKHDLKEQASTTERLLAQLTSVQAQRQQLIGDAWGQYIEQRGNATFGYDISDNRIVRAEDMTEAMRSTLQNGQPYVTIEDDKKLVNVPILLRGEVLGAMSFGVPPERPVTERQIELATTVALRLGSALESTRLLEQTQAQANRERKANELSNLLISTTDIDTLLK